MSNIEPEFGLAGLPTLPEEVLSGSPQIDRAIWEWVWGLNSRRGPLEAQRAWAEYQELRTEIDLGVGDVDAAQRRLKEIAETAMAVADFEIARDLADANAPPGLFPELTDGGQLPPNAGDILTPRPTRPDVVVFDAETGRIIPPEVLAELPAGLADIGIDPRPLPRTGEVPTQSVAGGAVGAVVGQLPFQFEDDSAAALLPPGSIVTPVLPSQTRQLVRRLAFQDGGSPFAPGDGPGSNSLNPGPRPNPPDAVPELPVNGGPPGGTPLPEQQPAPTPEVAPLPEVVTDEQQEALLGQILDALEPYLFGLTDEQIDALIDGIDLNQAASLLGGLASSFLETGRTAATGIADLAQLQLDRDRQVNDELFSLNRATELQNERAASRGIGRSGFRIQNNALLNRQAQSNIADINQAASQRQSQIRQSLFIDPVNTLVDQRTAQDDLELVRDALEALA